MSRPDTARPQVHAEEDTERCRRELRSFRAAPSFTGLQKLAELWDRAQRWELATQAWLHVAGARPHDAHALARAAFAAAKLQRLELSAELLARACRMQPDNREYQAAYARVARDTTPPLAQAKVNLGRTEV